MTDFVIKQLPYDLSNQAGLALIGKHLKRININALIDPAFPVRSGIANSDILKSYLGLLCLGKNDFDAIEGQRKDTFFARALHLRAVPSSPTLRQRLDAHAPDWFPKFDSSRTQVLDSIEFALQSADYKCGFWMAPGVGTASFSAHSSDFCTALICVSPLIFRPSWAWAV